MIIMIFTLFATTWGLRAMGVVWCLTLVGHIALTVTQRDKLFEAIFAIMHMFWLVGVTVILILLVYGMCC